MSAAGRFPAPIPLALYVHVPWCVRKCPYCDFNSHEASGVVPWAAYVEGVLAELGRMLPAVWGRRIGSVFFGGGTPSLMPPAHFAELMSGLRALAGLDAAVEVTVEANPGTVDETRFAAFRAAGATRISLGIQSFRDDRLAALGRIHGAEEARRAVQAARAAGFDALNVDLMHGLPGDEVAGAMEDLATAIDLGVRHLSWYQLTLEPGTVFHARPPRLPEEDRLEAIVEAGEAQLRGAGLRRYEISAWAEAGQECRHNLNYWHFGDYLGVGPGAHGKLTDFARGRILRTERPRGPRAWLAGVAEGVDPLAEARVVPASEVGFEFMLNALRLVDGFEAALIAERTGLDAACLEAPLRRAEARGLIRVQAGRIAPTALGLRFLNEALAEFLPPGDRSATGAAPAPQKERAGSRSGDRPE